MDELIHRVMNHFQTISCLAEKYECEEIMEFVREAAEDIRRVK